MMIQFTTKRVALTVSAALLLSTASMAYAYDAVQPEQTTSTAPASNESTIAHITGGVGDDERDALEAARGDYNVHITNSTKDGAFNDETQIIITDKKGNQVLSADAGPLFFVQLPAGSYTVVAQHREREQTKKIKITNAKKVQPDLHFVW